MQDWHDLADAKWKERARIEQFASRNEGEVEYRCAANGQWEVTTTIRAAPGTWIVSSGPKPSIEAACVEVIRRFGLAGLEID